MEPVEFGGERIDPAQVTSARGGNAIWPGLATFTGVSFLVYLLTKWGSGQIAPDAGLFGQLGVSAVLFGVGAFLLARGRYFHVAIETASGRRKLTGLSRAEQQRILRALGREG